jgi:hypothetical protein
MWQILGTLTLILTKQRAKMSFSSSRSAKVKQRSESQTKLMLHTLGPMGVKVQSGFEFGLAVSEE